MYFFFKEQTTLLHEWWLGKEMGYVGKKKDKMN